MAERLKIGLREVRALGPDQELWDTGVVGFGARRQSGEAVSYVLLYRAEGRQRRLTIGRHGAPWTPDTARDEARRLLGKVADGIDPAADKRAWRDAPTVNELCDAYWADAEAGRLMTRRRNPKAASTLASDKGRIDRHIRPLLGARKVAAVTLDDVESFMHDIAEGKTAVRVATGKKGGLAIVRGGMGAASRTIGLLGAIFAFAQRKKMRADNPVRGVMRPADGKRERRLSDDEYMALGNGLRAAADSVWPAAVAVTRFLAITGWRSGEALGLRWAEVDLVKRAATLGQTKTGRSVRPLSMAACDVLRSQPRVADLVFPATRGKGPMAGYRSLFNRIASLGELPADVTPHVLRHSLASLAADLEYSVFTVAGLLGHRLHGTTSGYAHMADSVMLAAADKVANETLTRMGEPPRSAEVVQFPQAASAA